MARTNQRLGKSGKKLLRKQHQTILNFRLLAAIKQQRATERDGGFAVCFPNCFRWLRDECYEGYLKDEKDALYKKRKGVTNKERPWEKDKPQDSELPF